MSWKTRGQTVNGSGEEVMAASMVGIDCHNARTMRKNTTARIG
jgi:hypothetical protein